MPRELLTEDQLITGLFEYIKLNKNIPDFFTTIKNNFDKYKDRLLALKKAIDEGDFSSSIFDDDNAALYLLYLINEKAIPYLQGMTIYTYLIGLAQFTTKQILRPEDEEVKSIRDFKTKPMASKGRLTFLGEEFLQHICNTFRTETSIELSYDELVQFILKLPSSEQALLEIQVFEIKPEKIIDRLLYGLTKQLPFNMLKKASHHIQCYIPSATLIDYLLHKISPEPIQAKYIFGSVRERTVQTLHKKHQHPMALYSSRVKSNLHDVNGLRCGPLIALLHDYAHTFWGTLLTPKEREDAFNCFVPLLESLKPQAAAVGDTSTVEFIELISDTIYDFNLSGRGVFATPLRVFYGISLVHLARDPVPQMTLDSMQTEFMNMQA